MGADSPGTKTVFLSSQGYNLHGSDQGYVPRKGVKGQSAPKLKIRNFLRFRLTSDKTIFDFFSQVRPRQSICGL